VPDKPRLPIRRFDVFAEYNRLKNLADGMPEDQAKGRGVWIAKVVAGRRGMPAQHDSPPGKDGKNGKAAEHSKEENAEDTFKSVGGEPQTEATFDHEIVERMGKEFYAEVFSPAIERAFAEGRRYEEIRDSIRKNWK
jgi:hypothetical protein